VVAGARSCRMTEGGHGSLTRYIRGNRSAFCLAAFCLPGRPPGYGGDRRVGLVQRLGCPGGWITALGGHRQATHERPGQRQGDSQQQPHPQAPGEKCPHAQGPFVVPREMLRRYPPCPGLTTSRAACSPQSHMVTRVGEHCAGFHSGFVGRRDDVPASAGQPRKALNCAGKVVGPCHSPDACAAGVSAMLPLFPRNVATGR
jgi:hypothetical protein